MPSKMRTVRVEVDRRSCRLTHLRKPHADGRDLVPRRVPSGRGGFSAAPPRPRGRRAAVRRRTLPGQRGDHQSSSAVKKARMSRPPAPVQVEHHKTTRWPRDRDKVNWPPRRGAGAPRNGSGPSVGHLRGSGVVERRMLQQPDRSSARPSESPPAAASTKATAVSLGDGSSEVSHLDHVSCPLAGRSQQPGPFQSWDSAREGRNVTPGASTRSARIPSRRTPGRVGGRPQCEPCPLRPGRGRHPRGSHPTGAQHPRVARVGRTDVVDPRPTRPRACRACTGGIRSGRAGSVAILSVAPAGGSA